MKTRFSQLLFFALLFSRMTLSGQNNALNFDGDGDYITATPVTGFSGNSDFTVEMQFLSTATGGTGSCFGDFRRLFALGGVGSRFEVGECNGFLSLYSVSTGILQAPINVRGAWHCLSVVRSGNNVATFLDGNPVPQLTQAGIGALNSTLFRVGHWPGGNATPGQDWLGAVDEVKLWRTALPVPQLTACNHCVLTGTEPDLVLYWQFDQGMADGTNTAITQATDASTQGNNGILHPFASVPDPGFDLMGPTGNFTHSGAPLVYPNYNNLTLEITSPAGTTPLTEICSGDPVKVCLRDAAGQVPPPGSPFAPVITWECSTNNGPFGPVSYTNFSPTQFCFSVPQNVVTANCSAPSTGFEDKVFRATLVVTDPVSGNACTYFSSTYALRICCPVPQPTVVLNVQPPGALNGTLCEGDAVVIDVSLTGLPAWFPAASGSVVTADWYLNGVLIPLPAGTTQFSYPITVGKNDLCFSVKIKNCACPAVMAETCIPVDPLPQCGTIIGCHPNLTLLASSPMLCYEICPFKDAALCIDLPFTDCIPHWEFSFDNVTWKPLGSSNATQNTNTLPCDDVGSPYAWPPGQQCIYYRIAGYPLSYPLPSGCEPCYSNTIKVCLKPAPLQPNVVFTGPQPICQNGTTVLSVTNPQAVTYTWYCNGVVVQTGPLAMYTANQQAWYWVEADNGCEIVESNHVFLQVCQIKARISCPLFPNPCAKLGEEIHLSGCASTCTCGLPLSYSWSASNGSPGTTSTTTNACDFYHIPDANGTTYTLTVTWTNGTITCIDTATIFVKPCQ